MHPVMLSAAPSAHPSTSYNASSSSSNGQRPSGHEGAIDLTGDDDDEPILVASRPAGQEDIVIDEKRSNALVCAGVVHGVVLCMYGLPVQLTYRGDYNSDPPRDPAFDKRNWPGITSFWSEKGYRPVMISVSGPQLSARSAHGGWATAGRGAEVHVAVIKPPGPNEEGRMVGPRVMQPFGALADKYVKALGELLLMRTVQVETRCKLVTQGRASVGANRLL